RRIGPAGGGRTRAALKPEWGALSDQVRLGVPGQAGNVLQYLNYRLDQFLVRAIRPRAEVGVYSVAVGLSESVWWISIAVSLALLPRKPSMEPDRAAEVGHVPLLRTRRIRDREVHMVVGAGDLSRARCREDQAEKQEVAEQSSRSHQSPV
ncbi:MAG: hypothetical protein AAB253_05220, partial [candidate division NC10 bacterium]